MVCGGRCGTSSVGEVCGRAALSSTLQPQCCHHPRRGPYGPMPGTTPWREAGASPTVEVCCCTGGNIYPNPSPRIFSQAQSSMTVRPKTQGVPQMPRPECWCCGQPGHWRRECPLREVGQVVQVVGTLNSAPGSEGAYCIPVRLQGSEHWALLDSGAMQTLIQQSVVRPETLVGNPWVSIRCVHGDIHKYPLLPIKIHYRGKKHSLKAAVSSCLSYPLMLGTDWAGFNQVAEDLVGVRPQQLAKYEVCAAVSGDAGAVRRSREVADIKGALLRNLRSFTL